MARTTKRHVPLLWENMFGTVYARSTETKKVQYFDYDWAAARQFAGVKDATDLRIARSPMSYSDGPREGQVALWGVPKRSK